MGTAIYFDKYLIQEPLITQLSPLFQHLRHRGCQTIFEITLGFDRLGHNLLDVISFNSP